MSESSRTRSTLTLAILLSAGLSDGVPPPSGADELVAGLTETLVAGILVGGVLGSVVGLFAGVPLVFLVGRHLPPAVAQRRARLLGALLPPIALLAVVSVLSGEVVRPGPGLPRGEDWWALVPFLAAAALGAPLASWAVGTDLPRPDVS